jgi:phage-related protein
MYHIDEMILKETVPPVSSATDKDKSRTQPRLSGRVIIWMGSSKEDISALPSPVKASFGHRLRQLQEGKTPLDMKPLPQFGPGVFELRERFDRNAYRLMYVVSLRKALYVLHAFMKKSKSGIGLSKPDAELIQVRLQSARALDKED